MEGVCRFIANKNYIYENESLSISMTFGICEFQTELALDDV